MNVGGISGSNGFYYQNKVSNNNVGKSFNEAINGAAGSQTPHLTLHKSAEGDAEKSIGSWANPNAGRSITIYEPQDFDPANPIYKMKIWDSEDNLIEERELDINSIDPRHADSYDMYALSVYGEHSGKCPDAVSRFTLMHAKQETEQTTVRGSYALETVENWMNILKDFMRQQYEAGNMQGYINAGRYYDFLSNF